MKPFLSIITINYNNVEGLKKTISSVVSQTFSDFEFIVIDGDSIDGSAEVVERNKDNFRYCVSEKDTGVYNAMNKGIKASKGDYLLFLNSGDIFTSETAIADFTAHPKFKGDIIYGDYKFEKGEKIYPDHLTPFFFMKTSLPHQSTIFKRKVFEEMGCYDERYNIVADRAFYLSCFLSGKFHFQHIKYLLTIFDLKGLSNNPVHKKNKQQEDEQMFKELYGLYYEDFKNVIQLQQQLKQANRKTIPGLIKRVQHKLKVIWNRP